MEVMLEIYQTLKALGMQWKEKGGQWGLSVGEDRQEMEEDEQNFAKESLDIYFVETRCRVREVVVRDLTFKRFLTGRFFFSLTCVLHFPCRFEWIFNSIKSTRRTTSWTFETRGTTRPTSVRTRSSTGSSAVGTLMRPRRLRGARRARIWIKGSWTCPVRSYSWSVRAG